MKDLPTNIVIRLDKRTFEILPRTALCHVIAAFGKIRRTVIEKQLDTSGVDAEFVYVAKDYQTPIRDAFWYFWLTNFAAEDGSPWMNYLKIDGAPGSSTLARRSHYENFLTQYFGKLWVFDLFVAFGMIDHEMIQWLNESCLNRAWETYQIQTCEETQRASTPPWPFGPNATETPIRHLSERSRAVALGFRETPVKGMINTPSYARVLRLEAQGSEEEVRQYEAEETAEFRRTDYWSDEQQQVWDWRRDHVKKLWDEAGQVSWASGFDFNNRHGKRVRIQKECIVGRAVRRYLAAETRRWDSVKGWIIGNAPPPNSGGCGRGP